MKRTTVKIPDELDALLRMEAQRRHVTISQLTREALQSHLNGAHPRRKLAAKGAGEGGREDVARRIEEILREDIRSRAIDPHEGFGR